MAQNFDLTQTGPELQERVDQVFPNRDAIEQETVTREAQDESLETSLKAYTDTEQARAEAVEGALDTRVSANEVDIDLLKSEYEALTQSDIIVGPLPSTGQPNKIYRVPGSTYYTDYMWANGGWVKLAEYSTLDGYVYKGIATPSGTPIQSAEAIFYFAVESGTYTNYGGLVVTNTIAILKYNGTAWTKDDVITIDNEPTAGSDNLVTSGAVAASVVYDISAANAVGGQLATYADLAAALDGGDNVPVDIRKGGMQIKFVQSSDNKYVQYRLMHDAWAVDVTVWQGVDKKPIGGSHNLPESDGVLDRISDAIDVFNGMRFDGNNTTPVIKDFQLTPGHRYKINISDNDFSRENIGTNVYCLFIGYSTDGTSNTELFGYKEDDTISTKEFTIDAIEAQYYRILIRADIGETLFVGLIDEGDLSVIQNMQKREDSLVSLSSAIAFTPNGMNPVIKDFQLITGHRYKIKIDNKNFPTTSITSATTILFIGYNIDGSGAHYSLYEYKKGGVTIDTDTFFIDAFPANYYRILLRGDIGNDVLISVEDLGAVTDIEYSIAGNDNNISFYDFTNLIVGCKYRLYPDKTWNKTNVTSAAYFFILHRDSGDTTNLIDVQVEDKENVVGTVIGMSDYYEFTVPYKTKYRVGVRADKGQLIKFRLEKMVNGNSIEALTQLHPTRISIIGDSISSYATAYMTNGHYYTPLTFGNVPYAYNYPRVDSDVINNTQIWWWKVAEIAGALIGENLSFSGSCASNFYQDRGYPSFYDRANTMLNQPTPDCIFIALGTNDYGQSVPLGNYDYDVSIENLDESKFRSAYIKGIKELQRRIPTAKIICLIFRMDDNNEGYSDSIKAIAEHYNLQWIDCRGYNRYDYPQGSHPSNKGMNQIANFILKEAIDIQG